MDIIFVYYVYVNQVGTLHLQVGISYMMWLMYFYIGRYSI